MDNNKNMKVLVTGSSGFLGKNISLRLKELKIDVLPFERENTIDQLKEYLKQCDGIIHLAGVNRPLSVEEFYDGNTNFTKLLVDLIKELKKEDVPFIMSSSIQAEKDNDYGKNKLMAENLVINADINSYIFRLNNVFGKWCKPNYNSAVSTFCYNIARDLPITVHDRNTLLHLDYIDDICEAFICIINGQQIKCSKEHRLSISPTYEATLGEIVDLLYSFKKRELLQIPLQGDEFSKKLYATYLSYLPHDKFSYDLDMHIDNRGSFTEIFKIDGYGQVSVNVGKPGITKGNHYHHTKNEKFLTVSGTCSIKFRKVGTIEVVEYIVSGEHLQVIDIPPGYTHNITNIGTTDSVTIMWANEPFNKEHPDTYYEEV